ncbi:hypothetical protein [Streptomyces sp. NPDC001658]
MSSATLLEAKQTHPEQVRHRCLSRELVTAKMAHPRMAFAALFFDGGRLGVAQHQQVARQADGLRSYDFHHAEGLPELTIPRLVHRITAGVQAREDGRTAQLEHGQSPEGER